MYLCLVSLKIGLCEIRYWEVSQGQALAPLLNIPLVIQKGHDV